MNGYFFILLTVLLTVYGQLILKWQVASLAPPEGAAGIAAFLAQALLRPWIVSGLAAAFLASLCWMLALKRLPLSTAYPFTAGSFVLVLIFAVLLFDEPLSLGKVAGALLIVAGILVIAYYS